MKASITFRQAAAVKASKVAVITLSAVCAVASLTCITLDAEIHGYIAGALALLGVYSVEQKGGEA